MVDGLSESIGSFEGRKEKTLIGIAEGKSDEVSDGRIVGYIC